MSPNCGERRCTTRAQHADRLELPHTFPGRFMTATWKLNEGLGAGSITSGATLSTRRSAALATRNELPCVVPMLGGIFPWENDFVATTTVWLPIASLG